jgi:hypothetical protein
VPAGVGSRSDSLGLRLSRLRRLSELVEVLGATADPASLDFARSSSAG